VVLSVAGYDPSGGAGLLADAKACAHLGVLAQGAATALTVQNEEEFLDPGFLPWERVEAQLAVLHRARRFCFVKVGLVQDAQMLRQILDFLERESPGAFVLWDPIVRASAGFAFHADPAPWQALLPRLSLVTPNAPEARFLGIEQGHARCAVFVKGGHRGAGAQTRNELFSAGADGTRARELLEARRVEGVERHGSGCTVSSLILARLALGEPLRLACQNAQREMPRFFEQGCGKLGIL
jgi:hydroxymethylpyrimidine/phosphomethylpyrimidine kinase